MKTRGKTSLVDKHSSWGRKCGKPPFWRPKVAYGKWVNRFKYLLLFTGTCAGDVWNPGSTQPEPRRAPAKRGCSAGAAGRAGGRHGRACSAPPRPRPHRGKRSRQVWFRGTETSSHTWRQPRSHGPDPAFAFQGGAQYVNANECNASLVRESKAFLISNIMYRILYQLFSLLIYSVDLFNYWKVNFDSDKINTGTSLCLGYLPGISWLISFIIHKTFSSLKYLQTATLYLKPMFAVWYCLLPTHTLIRYVHDGVAKLSLYL